MQSNRQLIKDGTLAENLWLYFEDDAALSDTASIVSLQPAQQSLKMSNPTLSWLVCRLGALAG